MYDSSTDRLPPSSDSAEPPNLTLHQSEEDARPSSQDYPDADRPRFASHTLSGTKRSPLTSIPSWQGSSLHEATSYQRSGWSAAPTASLVPPGVVSWSQQPSLSMPVTSGQGISFICPLSSSIPPSHDHLASRLTSCSNVSQAFQWPAPVPSAPAIPSIQVSPSTPDPAHTQFEPKSVEISSKSKLKERWILRGSCACAFVQYELSASRDELPLQACYCHCAMCRNLSGSNYIAFTSVPSERLRWFSGIWDWKRGRGIDITTQVRHVRDRYEYGKAPGFRVVNAGKNGDKGKEKVSDPGAAPWEIDFDTGVNENQHDTASRQIKGPQHQVGTDSEGESEPAIRLWSSSRKAVGASCARCGSTLFISYHSNVRTTDIALGTLWNSEDRGTTLVKPIMHIMLREKALWETIPEDGLQRFAGMPSEAEDWIEGNSQDEHTKPERTQEERMEGMKHLVKCLLVY